MLRYVLYVADHDIVPIARAFDFFDLCSGHREPVGQLFGWQIEVHVIGGAMKAGFSFDWVCFARSR